MQSTIQRRVRLGLSAFAATALSASLLGAPAVSAETYSSPSAPAKITVAQTTGGLKVYWRAVRGTPATTHYIISGGVGSCPIIVDGDRTNAVMPALSTDAMTVTVQAVNEYGISSPVATAIEVTPESVTTAPLKSVQLLQLSDFHGQLEPSRSFGAALLTSNFEAERLNNDATFTVSSGDNIGAAPPISSQNAELPTIQAMNAMGFDVSVFGNHEHDRNLAHLRQMIRYSDFEWVISNYNTLKGLDTGTKRAKSYQLVERDGVKVGFIGVNTKDTPEQITPGNLDFTWAGKDYTINISDSEERINRAIRDVKAAGADMVVALIHEGWNANTGGEAVGPLIDYAKSLDVDLVYGAHSHQTYSSVHDGKLTAMVRNAGAEYNRTQVCVNTATNTVLGASNEVITTKNAPVATADADVAELIADYKSELQAKMDVKVGQVNIVTPIAGTPPVQRSGEHAFGNWSADTARAKYGTDFALVNGGGIRSTFPASNYEPADTTLVRSDAAEGPYDIVLGDVYTIQPFGNVFSIIEVTGAQIWSALENGVSNYPSDGRWPHVSGMTYTADVTKEKGSRIVSITDLDGNAVPKDATTFTMVMTDFVAKGGDGYDMFDVSKLQVRDLDAEVLVEALRADMAAGKVTEMKLDGRTTVITE
ncbi:MAG TPA: 5'-nucleotidase C-terminal domain-containing protein [Aquiluna sp.]